MHLWDKHIVYAVLLSAQGALSWGGLGHRTVGYLAQKHLTDDAAIMVASLLKNDRGYDVSDACTWADAVRYRYPESRQWHYIGKFLSTFFYFPYSSFALFELGLVAKGYIPFLHICLLCISLSPDAEDDPPNNCSLNYKRDCNSHGKPGCIVSAFTKMVGSFCLLAF